MNVYFANVASEFLPARAVDVLQARGLRVGGNLLEGDGCELSAFDPDVIVYVPTRRTDAVSLPDDVARRIPIVSWSLYPDQLTGWICGHNRYGAALSARVARLYRSCAANLTNSHFTKAMLQPRAPAVRFGVCHLGIDTARIACLARRRGKHRRAGSVLWQHRWSADKNLQEALEIVHSLAARHPRVTFFLGRADDWQPCYVPEWLVEKYRRLCPSLLAMPNVVFVPPFTSQEDFWAFLSNVDIAFSCSYHESFGLAMLEQGCAGVACVVPRREAYPEVHKGALIVEANDVAAGVEALIEDPVLWQFTSAISRANALRFDVARVGEQLADIVLSACLRRQRRGPVGVGSRIRAVSRR